MAGQIKYSEPSSYFPKEVQAKFNKATKKKKTSTKATTTKKKK